MKAGNLFGHYNIIGKVAVGGMGTIYKAVDAEDPEKQELALKILKKGGKEGNAGDFLSWQRELEALSGLDHPHIVDLVETGEFEDKLFLAFEFIQGPTLAELLSDGPLRPGAVCKYVRQIALALEYTHAKDIVHLDLKPQNILLSGDPPVVKILDFGLSRVSSSLTREKATTAVSGTYSYMAPEQMDADSAGIGPQTDLYSLGMIFYEMLSGRLPFESRDLAEMMHNKSRGINIPLGDIVPGIPIALDKITSHLLDLDPSKRYRTASGLVKDLELCIEKMDNGEADFDFQPGGFDIALVHSKNVQLIGRETEYDKLCDLLRDSCSGNGSLVLLSGPAGIGKSRIVYEIIKKAEGTGGIPINGKCTHHTRNIPYYPLLTAVGEFLHRTETATAGKTQNVLLESREAGIALLSLLKGDSVDGNIRLSS